MSGGEFCAFENVVEGDCCEKVTLQQGPGRKGGTEPRGCLREKNRRHREQPPPHPQRRQECLDSPEEPGEAVGVCQVPGKGRGGRGDVGRRRAQIRRDPTGPAEGVGGSTAPPPLGCAPLYTAQVQGPEPELGVMLRVWWGPKDTALGSPGWFGMLSPGTGPSKPLDLSGPGFLVYLKGHRVPAQGQGAL